MILLNPGPVNLSDRVRNALLQPDLCHRESEFTQLQNDIRTDLVAVYDLDPQKYAAIVLTGSGTSAMEAMLTSLVPSGKKVVIIENGVYGERLSKIAEIYAIPHIKVQHEWGAEISLEKVERALMDEQVSHLAVVHHETTTGRLNSLAPLAALCAQSDVRILLDGVSSFGAEAISFDEFHIDGCAATANKCLHAVPGTSFVIATRSAVESGAERSLYLDLNRYFVNQEQGGTPFTQSVQAFYALREALRELADQGGRPARYQRYQQLASQVRSGLAKLEIVPLLAPEHSSVVLNAYYLPESLANESGYTSFHDALKRDGFIIYAGQGELVKTMFRVSTMGEISPADMDRFLDSVAKILAQ
jgi:2-aminoethylphosphonate-pyruvate transaminase